MNYLNNDGAFRSTMKRKAQNEVLNEKKMKMECELNGNPHKIPGMGKDNTELIEKNEKIDKINEELKEKISEISQQNELLNFQQKKIFNKSEALMKQKEEIQSFNESLKELVKERTRALETKNKQLDEYAFINSHVLRSPVLTMMGLINLIGYSNLSEEDQKIYEYLKETARVLDNVVFKITNAIDNGFHFDRQYLEPDKSVISNECEESVTYYSVNINRSFSPKIRHSE